MSKTMSVNEEGALAAQKAKKAALPFGERQTSWINSVNTLLHASPDPLGPLQWV